MKPGCLSTRVYRHHKGGERTFVRHLNQWTYKKEYAKLAREYYAFRPQDIVCVCGDHHEEVHDQMEQFDLDWMVENNCIKAFRHFTWEEACKLMEARRAFTNDWLLTKTPGIKSRRFTGRP